MDTPTARVIAQPRILSFLHILTFSPFFSPFSWNFSFVALHLFPRFSVFLCLSRIRRVEKRKRIGNGTKRDAYRIPRIGSWFFFFFRKLAFPKNRSRLGESNVGSWWNGCLSGFFLCSYMLLPLCGIFFIFLLFFFRRIFYIGFHVSTMAKIEIPQWRETRPSVRTVLFIRLTVKNVQLALPRV